MKLALALIGVASWSSSAALAEDLRMICKNDFHEYLLTFDTQARSLVLNPDTDKTTYKVLAFEKNASREGVAGMVGIKSNLGFYAEFRPKMRVDFYLDDKLFQSDTCRRVGENTPATNPPTK